MMDKLASKLARTSSSTNMVKREGKKNRFKTKSYRYGKDVEDSVVYHLLKEGWGHLNHRMA